MLTRLYGPLQHCHQIYYVQLIDALLRLSACDGTCNRTLDTVLERTS